MYTYKKFKRCSFPSGFSRLAELLEQKTFTFHLSHSFIFQQFLVRNLPSEILCEKLNKEILSKRNINNVYGNV